MLTLIIRTLKMIRKENDEHNLEVDVSGKCEDF